MRIYESISCIDISKLIRAGITTVAVDIEATIIHKDYDIVDLFPGVDPKIEQWFNNLNLLGVKTVAISNARDIDEIERIARLVGIPKENCVIRGTGKRWKPYPWRFKEAFRKLGISDLSKVAYIGDRPIIDFRAAKFIGAKAYLVEKNQFYKKDDFIENQVKKILMDAINEGICDIATLENYYEIYCPDTPGNIEPDILSKIEKKFDIKFVPEELDECKIVYDLIKIVKNLVDTKNLLKERV